jgi:large subunit ribosomal protein L10
MNKDEKKAIVESMKERLDRASILVLTDYKGMDVSKMTELRHKLYEADIEYKIVKNTLLRRAVKGTEFEVLTDHFKGPSAIALSFDDPVPPAKILTEFSKDNDKFDVKVGALGGKLLSTDDLKALSDLPSKEVLLAKLLSVMNAVPTSLVQALADAPRRLLNVLNAVKDQKES